MALQLTPDEQETVAASAKSEQDLPQYFNATLKKYVTISRDFEAFLILSTTDMKTSAIQWINKVIATQQSLSTRDKLRGIVLTQQANNSKAKLAAYETSIGNFTDFRDNFQTDPSSIPQNIDIPELNLFMQDLQIVIDEQILGQQKAFFDQTLAILFQSDQSVIGLTQDSIEELQSWIPVLSTYLQG